MIQLIKIEKIGSEKMANIQASILKNIAKCEQPLKSKGTVLISSDINENTLPMDLLMVVDVSGSMQGGGINVVTDSVIHVLNDLLRPEDRISVITFNSQAQVHTSWTDVNGTVAGFSAGGGTNFGAAVNEILSFLGSNDASIRLATTTKNHGEMFTPPAPESFGTGASAITINPVTSIGVKNNTFRDGESKQNNVEDWLLQREAQLQEFGSIVVKFTVPGNTSRHVGDLIRFEMPTSIPDDDSTISSLEVGHQLYSGNYIVSKIRHVITVDSYDMDMEIIKNSFAKRIGGQITEEVTNAN